MSKTKEESALQWIEELSPHSRWLAPACIPVTLQH